MTSDRIFVNGDIRTLDERNPNAQGLAAWRGRIVALGSNDDVLSLRTSRTEVVDLRGRVVLPGFTDAHAHFLGFSLQHTGRYVDLRQANSVEEALDAVRRLAEAVEDGEWIRGGRWDKNRWPTDAFPTRWQLDAVAPRNPTFLSNKDGHSVWVNSLALSAAGVTRETSAPEGGAILRDASGEPTGILQDAAIDLVARHLPPMDERQRRDALMEGMRAANALGVTGVHNCEGEDVFASFQELAREGRLTLRVVSHL
ncbi:MAG: amidohydrolase, partial [Armatimonadota bacterium]